MSHTAKISKQIVFTLLVCVIFEILFDPLSSAAHHVQVRRVQHEFPQAAARWSLSRSQSYILEIRGETSSICTPFAQITVQDDSVVQVEDLSSGDVLPPYRWVDPDWGDEVFLCNYNNFTVDRIFDMLEETLRYNPATVIEAEFDPLYGFVAHLKYGLFIPNGWLSPGITDCCSEFEIRNFQPLD